MNNQATSTAREATEKEQWEHVLESDDKDAFQALVEPYIDRLLKAVRHDLDYYVRQGHLHADDFSPEEILGETLVHAWDHRRLRPAKVSLKGWLLGTQYRVMRGVVEQTKAYRQDQAISLDAPIPINPENFANQEWFWEWFEWNDQLTWEDVVPGIEPVDLEIDLEHDRESLLRHLQQEEPDVRHALLMHFEFEMSLPEVAFAMGRSINDIATVLEEARAPLRERMSEDLTIDEADHPAPPEGSDDE